ncbi:MAG: competence/damage-inducible protein A [Endomicrobia bacterium]|nr:competence/damage-inducible protein A [Endomicrobiia bacterium]MCL2507143.1 competence/damage-inducible protein A [Endomicrobiia bacterium]
MKIELICTGTELLTGKLNTNAAYIGAKLSSIGLELSSVTDVSDRKAELSETFKRAFERSSIIIVTGGLGPTFDDITAETAAECLNLELYFDEKVSDSIKAFFAKRSLAEIPKINEKQARIIKGAKALENRFGTAPGQMLHFEYSSNGKNYRKTLFLLPGPPREMQPMFEENVEPFLKSYFSAIKKNEIIHAFGLPESVVEEMIKPVMDVAAFGDNKSVEFGILASDSVIDVKFSVSGTDEIFIDETLNNLKAEILNILKDNVFGFGSDTLESIIGKLLLESRKTVSFAESCTGGMIAQRITSVAGSSIYFKTSAVTYSNESKIKLLGVSQDTLNEFGAVSEQTAKEMALGVLNLAESDYALSVTGIAGPGGATKEKPVGLVYIGLASKKGVQAFKYNFFGSREDIRKRAANTALDLLRRKLVEDRKKTITNSKLRITNQRQKNF